MRSRDQKRAELAILKVLADHHESGLTLTQLRAHFGNSKAANDSFFISTIGRTMTDLVDEKFVERTTHPNNRCTKPYKLTPAGEQHLANELAAANDPFSVPNGGWQAMEEQRHLALQMKIAEGLTTLKEFTGTSPGRILEAAKELEKLLSGHSQRR